MDHNVMQKQQRIALLLILWRIPEFVTSFLAATASKSVVVWVEFIENASILIPGILLAVLSRKLGKNLKFMFNYGTGKVEAITALSCEMFDLAGLTCVLYFAVTELIRPREEEKQMLFALVVSLIGLGIDLFIFFRQKKLAEQEHSRMLHTAYLSAQKEFAFDFISLAALSTEMVFADKEWIRYVSPVMCILVSVPFAFVVLHHLKGAVQELADLTLDEESQMKILQVLGEFMGTYEDWGKIKSRVSGKYKYIDIEMRFPPQMTYAEVQDATKRIRERLREEIGESIVNIVIL